MKIKLLKDLTLVKAENTPNGFCHKNYWNFKNKKGIVYIGEGGFENAKEVIVDGDRYFILETVDTDYIETYESMYNATKRYCKRKKDRVALLNTVFDEIDWQHSGSLMYELYWDYKI